MSLESHVQIFLCLLFVAVAQSSSDGVRMCYVVPILGISDDVIFSHSWPYGGTSMQLQRRRCSVMRRLTPLLVVA